MAAGDLTGKAAVKEYLRIEASDATPDTLLDRLVSVASQDVKSTTRRQLSETAYTAQLYDGDGDTSDQGRKLSLREWPVFITPTAVSENGTSLTIATGYSTTADVIFDGRDGSLWRQNGSWAGSPCSYGYARSSSSQGRQNIAVSYTAGYLFPRSVAARDLPWDLEQVVIELAGLLYNEGPRLGQNTKQYEGWSMQFTRQLNPKSQEVLQFYSRALRVG